MSMYEIAKFMISIQVYSILNIVYSKLSLLIQVYSALDSYSKLLLLTRLTNQ